VYCRIVRSELKPEVVYQQLLTHKGVNSLEMLINGLGLPCLQVQNLLAQRSFAVSCKVGHTTGSRNI